MITRDVGDRVSVRYLARDANGTLTDTTMALLVTAPDGGTQSPAITHTSVGTYDAFFDLTSDGRWQWKWTASVNIVDVAEGYVDAATPASSKDLYVTLEEFKYEFSIDSMDTTKDQIMIAKLASAQGTVNRDTGRTFFRDATASQRIFEVHHLELLAVDDIATTTGLIVEVGYGSSWSAVDSSQYQVMGNDSLNPLAKGWCIEYLKRTFGVWPLPRRMAGGQAQQVRVTAVWGWPSVPEEIKNATILKAARLLRRKDSPEGIRGFSDFGVVRVTRYDPDYDNAIGNYVKQEV